MVQMVNPMSGVDPILPLSPNPTLQTQVALGLGIKVVGLELCDHNTRFHMSE